MRLRCELAVRRLLPIFRSVVANELVNTYRLTQGEVAEKMGLTQAAVSQYLHMKRGKDSIKQHNIIIKVEKAAKNTAKAISMNNISTEEAMNKACELCNEIWSNQQDM